jgi:SEL1 protein
VPPSPKIPNDNDHDGEDGHEAAVVAQQPQQRKKSNNDDDDSSNKKDEADLVYRVTMRGLNFGSDETAVAVRVNGVPALSVVLHNDTLISFAVPTVLLADETARKTSFLEVRIRDRLVVKNIPMSTISSDFEKVIIKDFRRAAIAAVGGSRVEDAGGQKEPGTKKAPPLERDLNGDADDASASMDAHVDRRKSSRRAPTDPTNESNSQENNMQRSGPEDHQESEANTEVLSNIEIYRRNTLKEAIRLLQEDVQHPKPNRVRNLLTEGIQLGDAEAMTLLGSLLLAGDTPGFPRDFDAGVPLITAASRQGFPDAQALHGFLLASGIAAPAVKKDTGAAILMWTFAAEAGSNMAKMALAYRYFQGIDVPENCELAATYYKDVARELVASLREKMGAVSGDDDDSGLVRIRPPTPKTMLLSDRKRLYENMPPRVLGESNEVIQYYKHAADRGDAAAQVMIGNLYYYGAASMPQNVRLARSLFERAALAGRADAHSHLGYMDIHEGNNHSAIVHLQIAAASGEKLGLHGMGYVTLHGIGVDRNAPLAALFFLKAAEAEHPDSMYSLALMHTLGLGVEKSSDEAFRYFQQAARFGHVQSSYHLGVKMLNGEYSARRDCNIAVGKYLKDVAQQGHWNHIISKALRSYEAGAYGNALYRYLQAAHVGIEIAQYNAAFMFEKNQVFNSGANWMSEDSRWFPWSLNGRGEYELSSATENRRRPYLKGGGTAWTRSQCVKEAIELYQMSSSQGYSASMVRMGDLAYIEGMDFSRATNAYERASKMRNAEAMFSLGWMHARGFGVVPDANLAKRYFDLAKATEPEAFIPATIAVYLLRYHGSILRLLEKREGFIAYCRALAISSGFEYLLESGVSLNDLWRQYGDIAILTILVGVLALVIYARQRRMLR